MAARSEFRKSQGVVPFGVGAITDFPDESLMMAGLDVWPTETADGEIRTKMIEASRVTDGRLARRLSASLQQRIDYFLSPIEAPEPAVHAGAAARAEGKGYMMFVRFPNWHFCPRCRVLKNIPWNVQSSGDSQLRCSNEGRRVDGSGEPCGKKPLKRRPFMSPVRFVTACESGHIMDFPWHRWAHRAKPDTCDYTDGSLYLYSTPAAGLAGVMVTCTKCNAKNSMATAFSKDALAKTFNHTCPGERPWLGPTAREMSCVAIPQTVQRGASNLYFPNVVSSILIPPYSALMEQTLDRPDLWEEIQAFVVDGEPINEHLRKFLRVKAKGLGFDADTFIAAVEERLKKDDGAPDTMAAISEEGYRLAEYRAYLGPRPPKQERHDFDIKPIPGSEFPDWFSDLIDAVVLVPKLRETRVLTGFSRLVPSGNVDSPPAKLSLQPKNWRPGFSVRGEGIFLRVRAERLQKWLTKPIVAARTVGLADRKDRRGSVVGSTFFPSPTFIMLHSLAHLLIRQLAFECGYDSSSLRERLYVSNDPNQEMNGILIYTASGDAEGTLGGLVRQGEPGRLDQTLRAAIVNASICSSDPLCIESKGQGTYSLNLAACHACALLPETSCETGNTLLDRGLVIGTPAVPELGYFSDILSLGAR